jgi:hypothetical protein
MTHTLDMNTHIPHMPTERIRTHIMDWDTDMPNKLIHIVNRQRHTYWLHAHIPDTHTCRLRTHIQDTHACWLHTDIHIGFINIYWIWTNEAWILPKIPDMDTHMLVTPTHIWDTYQHTV